MRCRAGLLLVCSAGCSIFGSLDGISGGAPPGAADGATLPPHDARDGSDGSHESDANLGADSNRPIDASDPTDAEPPCTLPTADPFNAPLGANWVLRGNATALGPGIRLTPNATDQVGQLLYDQRLTFDRFEATFRFRIPASAKPADGIFFHWLEAEKLPAAGVWILQAGTGFAVHIDTYRTADPPEDPTPSISILKARDFSRYASSPVLAPILDGLVHTVKVRLANGRVTVDFDGAPAVAATLPSAAPFAGYFGWTGRTGSLSSEHILTQVTLRVGTGGPCAAP